ncbi:MAG: hypothetical protein Q9164_004483, partial [Protoblastenia rupestris]
TQGTVIGDPPAPDTGIVLRANQICAFIETGHLYAEDLLAKELHYRASYVARYYSYQTSDESSHAPSTTRDSRAVIRGKSVDPRSYPSDWTIDKPQFTKALKSFEIKTRALWKHLGSPQQDLLLTTPSDTPELPPSPEEMEEIRQILQSLQEGQNKANETQKTMQEDIRNLQNK